MTGVPDLNGPESNDFWRTLDYYVELGRAEQDAEPPYEPEPRTAEDDARDAEMWKRHKLQNDRRQAEVGERAAAAKKALTQLRRLRPEIRHMRERFVLYCPAEAQCRLFTAYVWPTPRNSPMPAGNTLLVVASGPNGARPAFSSWDLTGEQLELDDSLPVRCDHGHGRFPISVPGQIVNGMYTADSPRLARRITDLLDLPSVGWVADTLML